MNISASPYKRHRFPSGIIQYAVWLYHRFNVSHRDIEDLFLGRHMVPAENYRLLRERAFASWKCAAVL
jgi:transposase-like protein